MSRRRCSCAVLLVLHLGIEEFEDLWHECMTYNVAEQHSLELLFKGAMGDEDADETGPELPSTPVHGALGQSALETSRYYSAKKRKGAFPSDNPSASEGRQFSLGWDVLQVLAVGEDRRSLNG